MKIGTGNKDIIFGTLGDDEIWGMGGDDTLIGGGGNDTLNGGTGKDTMQGGTGDDTYVVDDAGDKVVEYRGEGYDTVRASIDYTLNGNVEGLVLTGTDNIDGTGNGFDNDIYGNSGNNVLNGLGGTDFLYGGGGTDILIGGDGTDYMYGGTGDDVYSTDGNDYIGEKAGEGTDTVISSYSHELYANVENLILTGTAAYGNGNDLNNIIHGNSVDNAIDGKAGADAMYGGKGNDTYTVDNAGDTVIELSGEGHDAVKSTITWTLGANVEALYLQGSADLNGYGNGLDNELWGNAGNNILYGFEGKDIIEGGAGADIMVGGLGDDSYGVDSASDTVFELGGEGYDKIYLQADMDYKLADNVEYLSLGGYHSNGTGNALDNTIHGGMYDNVLDGGAGLDTLTGWGGNDTFVFHAGEAHGDTVMDFTGNGLAAGDVLKFSGYGSIAQGATFHQLTSTQWEIGSADGLHHDIITLANAPVLTADDFVFV